MEGCLICNKVIELDKLEEHINLCLDSQINVVDVPTYKPEKYELEPIQKSAIDFANKKAKIHAKASYSNALIMFIELGYTENDLKMAINYIENIADITINVRIATIIGHIVNDTHYKNCFEVRPTKYGGGNASRQNWENNMFNNIYDNAEPIDRVKYGAINLFNQEGGCASCKGYGESFFVLKKEVKKRSTFTVGDSAGMMFHIANFKHNNLMFMHMNKDLAHKFIKYLRNELTEGIPSYNYIEVQIHGLVRLNQDIEKLVVRSENLTDKKTEDTLLDFCFANSIELVVL